MRKEWKSENAPIAIRLDPPAARIQPPAVHRTQGVDLNALVMNMDSMLRRLIGEDIIGSATNCRPRPSDPRPMPAKSSKSS